MGDVLKICFDDTCIKSVPVGRLPSEKERGLGTGQPNSCCHGCISKGLDSGIAFTLTFKRIHITTSERHVLLRKYVLPGNGGDSTADTSSRFCLRTDEVKQCKL